ncbi:MAG: hypothetical protein N2316_08575, partial [Spirochaetes bacterium]|nr:hypothetical protein [Spirochaetota bacterium]
MKAGCPYLHKTYKTNLQAICFAFFSFAIILFFPSFSFPLEAVRIEKDHPYQLIGKHVEFLKDPQGNLTIHEVISQNYNNRFSPSTHDALNFAYTKAVYWLRFKVENSSNDEREFIFLDDYPLTDEIVLYAPDVDVAHPIKISGRLHPLNSRDEKYRAFAFRLTIPPRTARTYYLRVKSDDSLVVRPVILSPQQFSAHAYFSNFIFGGYFGLIGAMVIYYLFVFFTTKDVTNLIFAFMLTMLNGIFFLSLVGILPILLGTDLLFFSRTVISIGISSGAAIGLLFAKLFCHIDKKHGILNITFYVFIALEIIGALSSLFVRYLYVIVYCVLVTMGATVVMW